MSRAALKYWEIGRITLRSRWAYLAEQLLSNAFLALVIFVFVQLWTVTFRARGTAEIDGYTLTQMIWYLVATEALILSLPRVHMTIESEVKGGDLALRLNKPYSYLLFHYAAFLGEALGRTATTVLVGGIVAAATVGGFEFAWAGLPALAAIYVTTMALHFCFAAAIGLLAFWVEDVSGIHLVFDKIKWIAGGLLMPVEVYPERVRAMVEVLPFRHMLAGPARLFVRYSHGAAWELLTQQLLWLVLFALLCAGIYRVGVRRVDLNGG